MLLAVNPYKSLDSIYNEATKEKYRGKHIGALPPHPYAIPDVAYRHMLKASVSQSIVVSGESGAGKTETAKILMHYIAKISRTDNDRAGNIQEKVLKANPVLESFGNAQTLRNLNSSRFGKYNKMFFNQVGSLVGSGISTYLLESSRVCIQNPEERNYHIFYQLLAGAPSALLEELQLERNFGYALLQRGSDKNSTQSDAARFQECCAALTTIGLTQEDQTEIFKIIGALIHLGEFRFADKKTDSTKASPTETTNKEKTSSKKEDTDPDIELENFEQLCAADLLGIDEVSLLSALQWRTVTIKHRSSFYRAGRTSAQAHTTLQSFIKTIYKRLFSYIVDQINALSNVSTGINSKVEHIGILDIYGFERLSENSFEQLCINLANERLQQFFIENVLIAEQKTYAKEGLQWAQIPVPDSTPIVKAITGVLGILDDHSIRKVKNLDTNDEKFCQQVHNQYVGANPAISAPKMRAKTKMSLLDGFIVTHYAGAVLYTTRNWFDKNNDRMLPEIEDLIREAEGNSVMQALQQPVDEASGKKDTSNRFVSVGETYVKNLESLLRTLELNSLHYIRCFNPNGDQTPGMFDGKYVLEQVVQSGTVELVKIMHDGYPHRVGYDELQQRFAKLLPADFQQYDQRTFVDSIMKAFAIDEREWSLGVSKLFLRGGQLQALENLKADGCHATQEALSRIRRDIVKKKIKRVRTALFFINWLPRHMKRLRRTKLIQSLNSACFIVVRLYRWLNWSRGQIRRRDLDAARRTQQRKLTNDYTKPGLRLSKPRAFCMRGGRDGKENVVFHNGKSLFCAVHGERTVSDVYKINMDSGMLEKEPQSDSHTADISAIAQHPTCPFRLAVADVEGNIFIVDWLGIDAEAPYSVPVFSVNNVITTMSSCCDSEGVPHVAIARHIAYLPYDVASRTVLAVLIETTIDETGFGPAFFLQLVENNGPGCKQITHDTHMVDVSMSKLRKVVAQQKDRRRSDAPDIASNEIFSFLAPVQSGKMIILGGCATLNCYQILDRNGGLELALIHMLGCKYLDIELRNIRSCICLQRRVASDKQAKSNYANSAMGDFVIVGASDGTLFAFPFLYQRDKLSKQGKGQFIFDESNAGRFDVEESDDDHCDIESVELLFPVQKNYFSVSEGKFVALRRSRAWTWAMEEKNGIVGWFPQAPTLSSIPDNFSCGVSSRSQPNVSLFVVRQDPSEDGAAKADADAEEDTPDKGIHYKIARWNRSQPAVVR